MTFSPDNFVRISYEWFNVVYCCFSFKAGPNCIKQPAKINISPKKGTMSKTENCLPTPSFSRGTTVTRRGPLTTISGFIPSYTHLQPWLNRVCRGYNYLITREAPSCRFRVPYASFSCSEKPYGTILREVFHRQMELGNALRIPGWSLQLEGWVWTCMNRRGCWVGGPQNSQAFEGEIRILWVKYMFMHHCCWILDGNSERQSHWNHEWSTTPP